MIRTALDVHVLPDLPDGAASLPPGGRRGPEVTAPVDGATALDPTDVPVRPTALRLLPGGGATGQSSPGDDDHRVTVRRARRFVQAVLEIVSGDRPCTQLIRWTDRSVYDRLVQRVSAMSGVTGFAPATSHPRAKVVSIKVCRPRDGVAEIAAHVRQGRRSHALAARLERSEQRWICTALEWG